MRILITGISGFLGKYVVAQALKQGHQVRGILRSRKNAQESPLKDHPNLEILELDWQNPTGLSNALQEIQGVIHLAAAMEGDYETQFAGTVIPTENLLKAMIETQVLRLIAISTFSVFNYQKISSGSTIDEDSLLEENPIYRDAYARTKLIQENMIRDFAQNHHGQVTILRPGVIYGRDRLWNAYLGKPINHNLWLHIRTHALIPLIYVENCAEAIVKAAESQEAINMTFNLVDDDLPTQDLYFKQLIQRSPKPAFTIPIDWQVVRLLANTIGQCNQILFKNRIKLPGILVPARLNARFKAFKYSNNRAKQILKWHPKYSLKTALDRSYSTIDLFNQSQD